MKKQELLYARFSQGRALIPFRGSKPDYVWTVLRATDEAQKPELPLTPVHRSNAFLEDVMHDWAIRAGYLHYFSRIVDFEEEPGVWLLLEWNNV